MKVGFELEAFCLNAQGHPILVPAGLPLDECGWLIELRSDPHENVTKAVHLLFAEMDLVGKKAVQANCSLSLIPLLEIPRELKVQAARRHGKGLLRYRNIYGHETHRNSTKLQTASLHISFTDERSWAYTDKNNTTQYHKYPGFVDHAKLIVGLDTAFKQEIHDARRNPGFYEVKDDGRIEYRSLPNNVNMNKVQETLYTLLKD